MAKKKSDNKVMSKEEHRLLDSFLADSDLQYLKDWSKNLNSFHLKLMQEQDHSAMIAWLLNPRESHGFSDLAIKYLIRAAYHQVSDKPLVNDFFKGKSNSLADYERLSFGGALVCTELAVVDGRIDIVVIDIVQKIAIIIENKYGANSSDLQHSKYEKWADKDLSNYRKVFIHLDYYGGFDSNTKKLNERWIVLDYSWLTQLLAYLKKQNNNDRVSNIINDYYSYLNEDDLQDDSYYKEVHEVCIRLINRHEVIIDKIEEIKPWNAAKSHLFSNILLETNNSLNYHVSLFEMLYPSVLSLLTEYGCFDALIESLNKKYSFESELNKNSIFLFHPEWLIYSKDEEGYWVLYLELKPSKNVESNTYIKDKKYDLFLSLHKKNANSLGLSAVERLLSRFEIKMLSSQLNKNIPLDKDLMLNVESTVDKIAKWYREINEVLN
jgi:hypothetical protein